MEKYKPRTIRFNEIVNVQEWKVKVYTISMAGELKHPAIYKNAIDKLPEWLEMNNSFDSRNEKIAFLILHSGAEGIFSLINWWVGKNMLNTHTFITYPQAPEQFKKISGDGLVACVWEMEIINHERVSWMKNVLKQAPNPNYKSYLADNYNGKV